MTNDTNTPDPLIIYHHSELSKLEADEAVAKAELAAVKKQKLNYRKTIQSDGVVLKSFDEARRMMLADPDEVAADFAEQARYLRAFKSPLSHQFDLFDQPDRTAQEDRWKHDGFRAGANADDRFSNPHLNGPGHKVWDDGWLDAQKVIAAGMSISKSAQKADEDEDGDDETDAVEPADLGPDGDMNDEDFPFDPDPEDEDAALAGVEG